MHFDLRLPAIALVVGIFPPGDVEDDEDPQGYGGFTRMD